MSGRLRGHGACVRAAPGHQRVSFFFCTPQQPSGWPGAALNRVKPACSPEAGFLVGRSMSVNDCVTQGPDTRPDTRPDKRTRILARASRAAAAPPIPPPSRVQSEMAEDDDARQPRWEGPLDEQGLPHGTGVMAYPLAAPGAEGEGDGAEPPPGDVFRGAMEHGERQGRGRYTFGASRTEYDGEYERGVRHGHGVMVFPDGSRYEGRWAANAMEGEGTYTYACGDVFMGGFKAGKKHGEGKYHFRTHSCQFQGVWVDGEFVEGKWVHRDGTTFKGSFEGSVPSQGTFFFARPGLVQAGSYSVGTGWRGAAGVSAAAVAQR